MPVYSIQLPDQRTLDIEAADPQTALQGAQEWHQANPISTGTDIEKSAVQAAKDLVINTAGTVGDIPGAGAAIGKLITDKLGFTNPNVPLPQPPSLSPTSSMIKSGLQPFIGKDYVPQTGAGEMTKTSIELAPMLLGKGSAIRKGISYISSLGANEAAKSATDNPYIQTAATVAAGLPAWIGSSNAARATIADVKNAAEAGYKAPEVGTLVFNPGAVDNLADTIAADLKRAKANDRLAPQTNALVDEMKTPVNGFWHTYEDLQTTRELLEKQAANFNNPQEQRAATIALKKLTNYIDNIPQSDVARGNGPAASATLTAARGNYASAKTAERVADKIYNADVQAGSTYSGGNTNNAIRQKLRPLLTSKKQGRGLTEDELQQVEDTVQGSNVGNALRATGKFLGGGGGLGSMISAGAGGTLGSAFGPIGTLVGAVTAPAVGIGVRKIGDAVTRRKANQVVQAILNRSPYGQALPPPPTTIQALLNAPPWLRNALLASAPLLPVVQQRQPVQ